MAYAIKKVEKRLNKYKRVVYLVIEEGTPHVAVHKHEKGALVSLRYLQKGKAHFCECGNFIIGVPSRVASHFCTITGKQSNE